MWGRVALPYRAPSHLSHSSADTQEPLSQGLTSSLDPSGCQIRAIINHSATQGTYLEHVKKRFSCQNSQKYLI